MPEPSTVSAGWRRPLAGAIALIVLTSLVLVGSRWRRAGSDPRAPHEPDSLVAAQAAPLSFSPTRVVPGLYLLGGLSPGAAYAVQTSAGLVLIDAGLDKDAAPLKLEATKLGLDWKTTRAILLTHTHGDHVGGAQHLRTATGAKVYAGRGDTAVLEAGAPREAFFSCSSTARFTK